MLYSELQTAIKEFRLLGYTSEIKLNSPKATLHAEYDRLVAEKNQQETLMDASAAFDEVEPTAADVENFIQLSNQAESLAAVAETVVFDEVATPQTFDTYLTDMEDFLDRATTFENSEVTDPEEKATELLEKSEETKVYSIPQPLQYLQKFFSDEDEVIEPFTLDAIPAFETPIPTDEEWEVAEFYGAIFQAPAPASAPNHGTAAVTLIVLLLQCLQLILTVLIPAIIQIFVIGRKTFDTVALQSEPLHKLVDAG